jgi:hypothetical protein
MIQKSWNDKKILKYCREHKYSNVFNKEYKQVIPSTPVYEVTRYVNSKHPDIEKILEWCKKNCLYRYEMCQWHLGYENNIFFKFYSKLDYLNYYRWYDKTFLPKIEIEIR